MFMPSLKFDILIWHLYGLAHFGTQLQVATRGTAVLDFIFSCLILPVKREILLPTIANFLLILVCLIIGGFSLIVGSLP